MEITTVAALVSDARGQVEELTPEDLAREIANGALLVDIREPEERAANGHIPGNHHAPRGMIEFYADPTSPYYREEFDPSRRVILYCASGGRSALSAMTLKQLGYGNVAHLAGGINAWKDAGNAVTTD